jgi:hypothetical protein
VGKLFEFLLILRINLAGGSPSFSMKQMVGAAEPAKTAAG